MGQARREGSPAQVIPPHILASAAVGRFGIELELGDSGLSAGIRYCDCGSPCCRGEYESDEPDKRVYDVLALFRNNGLTDHGDLCPYHCGCWMCDYSRDDTGSNFLAAQRDCSVAMEFVSRIATVNDWEQVTEIGLTLDTIYARGDLPRPSQWDQWGNHIHVGVDDVNVDIAGAWVNALFCQPEMDWEALAAGGRSGLRSYNSKPTKYAGGGAYYGNWVSPDHYKGTVELRLWNTPRSGWYIGFHVAASLAMLRWAWIMVGDNPTLTNWDRILDTVDAANKVTIFDTIIDCWPDVPQRDEHIGQFIRCMAPSVLARIRPRVAA